MMKMIKEFKEFALRGNVVDMAVGVVIGAGFGKVVTSFLNDLVMPIIGLLLGSADFADLAITLKEGSQGVKPVTWNYGAFLTNTTDFVIVAFVIFMVIKGMNTLREKEPVPPPTPTEKKCPECLMNIPIQAKRCGHCAVAVT